MKRRVVAAKPVITAKRLPWRRCDLQKVRSLDSCSYLCILSAFKESHSKLTHSVASLRLDAHFPCFGRKSPDRLCFAQDLPQGAAIKARSTRLTFAGFRMAPLSYPRSDLDTV